MITWESISKATEGMKPVPIKNKDYVQVNERVKAFRQICPGGSICTDIVSMDGDVVVMKATIMDEHGNVLSTGLAFEDKNSNYINKTSYIENCETSAVGRALGFLAIGVDASMCSAEELVNALVNQNRQKEEAIDPKEAADIAATERGIRNTKKLKDLSAKTGLAGTDLNRWKVRAVTNNIIPDKKWAEYSDKEIDDFIRFVEVNYEGDA